MLALLVATALAQGVRLDAGLPDSPVLDGFARLHPDGSDDPRVSWRVPPRAARAGDGPDPLRLDHVVGGTLHLDLPPGDWDVHALFGEAVPTFTTWWTDRFGLRVDGAEVIAVEVPRGLHAFLASPLYSANPRPVFRPDETAWDRVIRPNGPWRRATVRSGDGGLEVAPFGLPLQALVVTPAEARPETEVALALADAARERWWVEHAGVPRVAAPVAVPGPLAVTFTSLESLEPGTAGPPALHLGRGDRGSVLAWMGGGDGAGRVEVEAPRGLRVTVIEADWLDHGSHPERPLRPRPTVLREHDGWRGGQGAPPVLLVTVSTAPDAAAGRRAVRLRFHRGEEAVEAVLPVHVHAATPSDRPWGGVFVEIAHAARLRGTPDDVLRVLRDVLDVLDAHGVRDLSLRFGADPETLDAAVLRAVADWPEHLLIWPDVQGELRRHGDDRVPDARLARMLADAVAAGPKVHVQVFEEDDWRYERSVEQGRARLARIERLAPGVPTVAFFASPVGWPLASEVDVAIVGGWGPRFFEGIAHIRRAGAVPWAYNLAPGVSGGWLAWAARADGLFQWHADPLPFDPFDAVSPAERRNLLFLDTDGIVRPSLLLAAMADGLADARVLVALEEALPRLPRAARARAEALLGATRAALAEARPAATADGVLLEPASRAAIRAEALRLLACAR